MFKGKGWIRENQAKMLSSHARGSVEAWHALGGQVETAVSRVEQKPVNMTSTLEVCSRQNRGSASMETQTHKRDMVLL